MRRKEKEIQDKEIIERVIAKAQVCRLGLCRDNLPYIVPVNFGYDGVFLYFHTASEGLKLEIIAANPQVCFELEHDVKVVPNDDAACSWSTSYYSVIGFGAIEEITQPGAKTAAMGQIMRHYSQQDWTFNDKRLEKTRLWRIAIRQMTGKKSNDKVSV